MERNLQYFINHLPKSQFNGWRCLNSMHIGKEKNMFIYFALLISVLYSGCGANDRRSPSTIDIAGYSYPPEGIYSLTDPNIPVASILANSSVAGISIRTTWDNIEPREGVFDWNPVDFILNDVRTAGKKASITIIPGVHTPSWVYAKGAQKFTFFDNNFFSPTFGQNLTCPMPWDNVFLNAWKDFIEKFAEKYDQESPVSWIRITGPMNTLSGDWNLQSKEDWDKYIGTSNEFSDSRLISAIDEVIDTFALSFSSKPLSLAIGRTRITDTSPFLNAATEVVNYGFARYGDKFLLQVNGWDAQVVPPASAGPEETFLLQHAPFIGAQMVWSVTNDPYCRMNRGVMPCDSYIDFDISLERASEYNVNFLEIYAVDILNPDLQNILQGF